MKALQEIKCQKSNIKMTGLSLRDKDFLNFAFCFIAIMLLLTLPCYNLPAQEGSPKAAEAAEAIKREGGSATPEQIEQAVRSRSGQQPQEKPAEQPGGQKETPPAGQQPQEQPAEKPKEQKEAPPAQAPAEGPAAEKLSAIEQLLSGQATGDVSKNLRQFGYELFGKSVSTFAPVTNVPVGPDYIVGPDDSFTVTLWGRINAQYSVTVDRNGAIALPEIGMLKVWGMTFKKLEEYLYNEFSRKYTDFKMAVTMNRLRTIMVYVTGEAQTPGSYLLSSLSTIINALFASGGPSKNGTLRKIQLVRNSAKPVTFDLYDFLLAGDKSKDVRLQDGDAIFIPLIGPVVGVAGNVKRPAIYELSQPMTLAEVLDLAGGVTYAGWLQRVQVERVERNQKRIVADFDLSEKADISKEKQASDVLVQDGDVIKIFSISPLEQNVVYLEGHIVRPGKYEFKPGMRLRDILGSYDVLQPQPNLGYGEIERLVEPDFHPIVIPFNVGKLLSGDESENRELNRFDTIRLFRWDEKAKQSVSISGQVYRPGEYRFVPGMKLDELIDAAGGLQKNAYVKRAELTRRYLDQNGMYSERVNIDLEKAMSGDPQNNIALQDYDQIVVFGLPELVLHDESVLVGGLVHKPGDYRLFEGMHLKDLIILAGGLQKNAYLKTAEVTRRHISQSGMQTEKIDLDLEKALAGDPQNNIILQDYDYLVVRPIPELEFDRTANVSGEVRFPGTYPVKRGETLSSLIERAGGYTERAYLRGAVFTRESAKTVQQQRMDQLVRQIEETMLVNTNRGISGALDAESLQAQQASFEAQKQLISQIKAAKIDGRVVIKLASLDNFKNSKYDLELEKSDFLVIPETPSIIHVVGEVFNPTSLLYEKDRSVSYYLNKVGGLTKEADRKQLSVIRADGTVVSITQDRIGNIAWDDESHQWVLGGLMSMELYPGDTIIVPRKLDKFLWMKNAKDITQIIFNAAIAAGIVLAI